MAGALAALGSPPAADAATIHLDCVEVTYGMRANITVDTDTGGVAYVAYGRRNDYRAQVSSHSIQWQWSGGQTSETYVIDRYSGRMEVTTRNAAGGGKHTYNCRTVPSPQRKIE